MRQAAENDAALAQQMKGLLKADPAIGFESELMNYCYTETLLDAKIRQVEQMLSTLPRWEQSGVEKEVLARVVPAPPSSPPQASPSDPADKDPLRWGD